MRSNVTQYALIAPATLPAALAALAENPGRYTPIAGGTELMVALSAGRLAQKNLLSLHNLHELRFIDVMPESITLGAGATFTDLRRHPVVASDFPLLAQAGSWLGSVANQNRATIGGNIVNASPAADSPPALLVYDASITLVSTRGARTIPYTDFHLSYKKTVLAPDELLFSVTLPRRFAAYRGYIRKVGTRNAQAISKIALAGVALIATDAGAPPTRSLGGIEPPDSGSGYRIADIRLAAASLREVPTRCTAADSVVEGVASAAAVAALAAKHGVEMPVVDAVDTVLHRGKAIPPVIEGLLARPRRAE